MSDTQTEIAKLRVKAGEEERKNATLGPSDSNVGQAVKANRPDREHVNEHNEKVEKKGK